jgi:DNA polymerase III subunit chi
MSLRGVEFHTGLTEPLAFACRLLRKAQRQGYRLLVTAPEPRLAELDALLWTFEPESFVPHVRLPGAPEGVAARTPIWLCEAVPAGAVPSVLVNLGAAAPASLAHFERVIEIVSHEVDEAQAGRERWRVYKAQGLEIVHHPAAAVSVARD